MKIYPQTESQYILVDISYLVLKILICKSVMSLPSCEDYVQFVLKRTKSKCVEIRIWWPPFFYRKIFRKTFMDASLKWFLVSTIITNSLCSLFIFYWACFPRYPLFSKLVPQDPSWPSNSCFRITHLIKISYTYNISSDFSLINHLAELFSMLWNSWKWKVVQRWFLYPCILTLFRICPQSEIK